VYVLVNANQFGHAYD